MIILTYYYRLDCSLCEPFKKVIAEVIQTKALKDLCTLSSINIDENPEAFAKFHEKIPVLEINGRLAFKYKITTLSLKNALAKLI